MSTTATILIVGAGGIGTPAALALAAAGAERIVLVDDDDVDLSNLHRQILFGEDDLGRPKLDALAAALVARFPKLDVKLDRGRLLPDSALARVSGADVVIDATDNFASRFLIADACAIANVAVVHAAAVRWHATVLPVAASGRPCYRCLFEDLPGEGAPDCSTAGVAGPICGVAGAIAADRALRMLEGDSSVFGAIVTYDGLRDVLRCVPVARRRACPLCGESRSIRTIDSARYEGPVCSFEGDDEPWKSPSASPPH